MPSCSSSRPRATASSGLAAGGETCPGAPQRAGGAGRTRRCGRRGPASRPTSAACSPSRRHRCTERGSHGRPRRDRTLCAAGPETPSTSGCEERWEQSRTGVGDVVGTDRYNTACSHAYPLRAHRGGRVSSGGKGRIRARVPKPDISKNLPRRHSVRDARGPIPQKKVSPLSHTLSPTTHSDARGTSRPSRATLHPSPPTPGWARRHPRRLPTCQGAHRRGGAWQAGAPDRTAYGNRTRLARLKTWSPNR